MPGQPVLFFGLVQFSGRFQGHAENVGWLDIQRLDADPLAEHGDGVLDAPDFAEEITQALQDHGIVRRLSGRFFEKTPSLHQSPLQALAQTPNAQYRRRVRGQGD